MAVARKRGHNYINFPDTPPALLKKEAPSKIPLILANFGFSREIYTCDFHRTFEFTGDQNKPCLDSEGPTCISPLIHSASSFSHIFQWPSMAVTEPKVGGCPTENKTNG